MSEHGGVAHGLALNGHSHYWATCSEHGWNGPFRSTEKRAQEDLADHIGEVPE